MRPEDARDPTLPTPEDQLVDGKGRLYFLRDVDMTLEEFRTSLRDPDPEVRAYLAGKLMRQARVGDVDRFLSAAEARSLWPLLSRYLGRTREAWRARLGIGDEPRLPNREALRAELAEGEASGIADDSSLQGVLAEFRSRRSP